MYGGNAIPSSFFLVKIPTTITTAITTSSPTTSVTTRTPQRTTTPSTLPITVTTASTGNTKSNKHAELSTTAKILIGTIIGFFVAACILHFVCLRYVRWYAKLWKKTPGPSRKARGKRRASGEMVEEWRKREERRAMAPIRINVTDDPVAPSNSGDNSDVQDLVEELRRRETPISVRYDRVGESSGGNGNGMLRTITEEPVVGKEGEEANSSGEDKHKSTIGALAVIKIGVGYFGKVVKTWMGEPRK